MIQPSELTERRGRHNRNHREQMPQSSELPGQRVRAHRSHSLRATRVQMLQAQPVPSFRGRHNRNRNRPQRGWSIRQPA